MSTKKCTKNVVPLPHGPPHRSRRRGQANGYHRQRRQKFVNKLLKNRQATMDAAAKTWARVLYPGCINAGGGGVGALLQSYAERAQGIAPRSGFGCGGCRRGRDGGRATNMLPYISGSPCRAKSAPTPTPFGLYGGRRCRRSLTRKRRGRRRSRAKRKKTGKKRRNRSKYHR
jgi:hypothetical protein